MKKYFFIAMLISGVTLFFMASYHGNSSERKSETSNNNRLTEGSLFIIGGGSRPDTLVQRMLSEAEVFKNQGYVFILPMSSSLPDSAIMWASEQFLKNGIPKERIKGYSFSHENKPWRQSLLDSLLNADLIYISGGDQARFMDVVQDSELFSVIHNAYQKGSMIAGTSAGAAVMSEIMITGNELNYDDYRSTYRALEKNNIETREGLGLIKDYVIDQHFVMRSRYNRLLTSIMEFPDTQGIGIDESTAILVKNGKALVIGESQVILFSYDGNVNISENSKFGAKNIRLDIYLAGEKFKIKNSN